MTAPDFWLTSGFHLLGRDPAYNATLRAFLLAAIPLQCLQVILYPLQCMLIAQATTLPVMCAATAAVAAHLPANYLLVSHAGWGLPGAAAALAASYAVMVGFLAGYAAAAGLGDRMWGG